MARGGDDFARKQQVADLHLPVELLAQFPPQGIGDRLPISDPASWEGHMLGAAPGLAVDDELVAVPDRGVNVNAHRDHSARASAEAQGAGTISGTGSPNTLRYESSP